jgi:hypothetical protein
MYGAEIAGSGLLRTCTQRDNHLRSQPLEIVQAARDHGADIYELLPAGVLPCGEEVKGPSTLEVFKLQLVKAIDVLTRSFAIDWPSSRFQNIPTSR